MIRRLEVSFSSDRGRTTMRLAGELHMDVVDHADRELDAAEAPAPPMWSST